MNRQHRPYLTMKRTEVAAVPLGHCLTDNRQHRHPATDDGIELVIHSDQTAFVTLMASAAAASNADVAAAAAAD